MLFVGAMIAPAALAVGVLMAGLAGYKEAARGSIADHGEQAVAQAEQRSATELSQAGTPAEAPSVGQAPGEGPTFTSRTDLGGGLPADITKFEPMAAPPIAPRRGHPGADARDRSATVEDGDAGRAHPATTPGATAAPSPTPRPSASPSAARPDGASAASTAEPSGRGTVRDQAVPGTARDSALRIGRNMGGTAEVTGAAHATGAAGATTDRKTTADRKTTSDRKAAADRTTAGDGQTAGDRAAAYEATTNRAATGAAEPAPGNGASANPADQNTTNGTDVTAAMTLGGQVGEGRRVVSVTAGRRDLLDQTRGAPPFGPALLYGGLIQLPRQTPVRQTATGGQRPKAVPRNEPQPVETPPTCTAEWRDTWLWELCRERVGATLSTATGDSPAVRTHLSGQAPSTPTKRSNGS